MYFFYISITPDLQKSSSVRILALVLISLVALSAVIGIIAGFTYSGKSYYTPGTRKITMDDIFNGTFYPSWAEVNWVAEGKYRRNLRLARLDQNLLNSW